jgi:hypothetical protein
MLAALRSVLSPSYACSHGIGHAVHGVDLGVFGSVSRQRGVGLGTVPVTHLDADCDAAVSPVADDGGAVIADDGDHGAVRAVGMRLASDPTSFAGVIVGGSHQVLLSEGERTGFVRLRVMCARR